MESLLTKLLYNEVPLNQVTIEEVPLNQVAVKEVPLNQVVVPRYMYTKKLLVRATLYPSPHWGHW